MPFNFWYTLIENVVYAVLFRTTVNIPLHVDWGLVAVTNLYAVELFTILTLFLGTFITLNNFFLLMSTALAIWLLTRFAPVRFIIRILLFFL